MGIFIITFLGAIALPLPSGSVLMAASAFAVQGYMSFPLVLITGIAGNMAGDSSGYWLVRLFGLGAVKKAGLGRFFKEDKLAAARKQIENHRILTIYFSRFMTAIAPAVNIVCGFTRLPYKEYLLFESLGEITECLMFCFIGYIFGSNWEYLNQLSGNLWIIILAGALTSFMVARVIFKKK
ncbi:MAG: DedA family protein [Candidatus Doudnabacteria bacterium]|nr:DedA family protein [Candidatus Doudnabacteria bacterium]